MQKSLLCLSILSLCFLTACSTTDRRISKNQALFDSYTAEQQNQIRNGEVAIGFTRDQVRMALGEPDLKATIESEEGKQTIWEYNRGDPGLGLSLGVGSVFGGRRSVGTGVGVHSHSNNTKLEKVVVFNRETGTVSQIESYDN